MDWVFIIWLVIEINGKELSPRIEVHAHSEEECVLLREKAMKFFVDVSPCQIRDAK